MTDHNEDRPLTRRERRIRELGETGAIQVPETAPTGSVEGPSFDDIEISPYDENGRPRTRREMRELREQAIAERVAEYEAAQEEGEPEADPAVPDDLPDTQAFSYAQLQEATEQPVDDSDEDAEDVSELLEAPEALEDEALEAEAVQSAPEQQIEPAPDVGPDAPADTDEPDDKQDPEPAVDEDVSVESLFEGETADEPAAELDDPEQLDEPEEQVVDAVEVDTEAEGEDSEEYSFPDIVPLDDDVSVFDDPEAHFPETGDEAEAESDFDEIISDAVAEETASTTSGTSALILPNMPDTGDLTGPLGETGDLFVTGSYELPRNLSETGGQLGVHDSGESDVFDDLDFETGPQEDTGSTPVSAARAVSARSVAGPVVTETKKDTKKLPLVLMLTGGGLLVVVGGIAAWAWSAGVFG